jgi:hypothetical protein
MEIASEDLPFGINASYWDRLIAVMEIASEDLPFGINASYWDRLIAVMEIASEDRAQTTELTICFYFIFFCWYLIFPVQVK